MGEDIKGVPAWKVLMGLKDGEDVGSLVGGNLRVGLKKLFLDYVVFFKIILVKFKFNFIF